MSVQAAGEGGRHLTYGQTLSLFKQISKSDEFFGEAKQTTSH